jgi:hypothetical protein
MKLDLARTFTNNFCATVLELKQRIKHKRITSSAKIGPNISKQLQPSAKGILRPEVKWSCSVIHHYNGCWLSSVPEGGYIAKANMGSCQVHVESAPLQNEGPDGPVSQAFSATSGGVISQPPWSGGPLDWFQNSRWHCQHRSWGPAQQWVTAGDNSGWRHPEPPKGRWVWLPDEENNGGPGPRQWTRGRDVEQRENGNKK